MASATVTASVVPGIGSAASSPAPAQAGGGLGYDETIEISVTDIEEFWADALPASYDIEYETIDDLLPYDSSTDVETISDCFEGASYEDVADNALYCLLDDRVVYDDEGLFPRLFDDFGPFSIAMVLAHEWGHAIQGRILTFDEFVNAPSIQKELQADCFAGAWVGYVDEGSSQNLVLEAGDIEIGLAGMLEFSDPLGNDPTTQGAHGNGFDRVNAFSEGFEQGVDRCAEYESTLPPVTELPFTSETDLANEGDLPLDDALDIGVQDLDLYWEAVFEVNELAYESVSEVVPYRVRRRSTLPACESLELSPRRPRDYAGLVFYCEDDDFIAFDERLISAVHSEIGDFGAINLIGNAWAEAMQSSTRLDLANGSDIDVALQADCFAGAWAGSVPIDLDGDGLGDFAARGTEIVRDDAVILLSPGDLDEVVSSMLQLTAAEEDIGEISAFERVQAFRLGFFSTTAESDCAALTG